MTEVKTKRQSASLDRRKLLADPIMVTTIVVLIAFLTLFIRLLFTVFPNDKNTK